MSQLEYRLSQEMHSLAERVVPGDLRPLRPPVPGAWSRDARRRPAPAVVIMAIAVVIGVLVTARHELSPQPNRPSTTGLGADPATVAIASASNVVRVLTVATGRVITTLRVATGGNGVALSPDAKSVFVAGPTLMLSQVVIATGKARRIGTGAYPAVSPDSRFLAYAAGSGFTTVAIRDLRTGLTRSINLDSLVGSDSSLLNQGGLTWLGDGTQIVAVSEPDAIALTAVHKTIPAANHTDCGQQTSLRGLCAIVINVAFQSMSAEVRGSSPGLALHAYRVYVPHILAQQYLDLLSGDLAQRHSFFIAQPSISQPGRSASVVHKVRLDGRTPAARMLAVLPPKSIPVAMAPYGDRLIYVLSGVPTSLWVAAVHNGQLKHKRRLMTDGRQSGVNVVAW